MEGGGRHLLEKATVSEESKPGKPIIVNAEGLSIRVIRVEPKNYHFDLLTAGEALDLAADLVAAVRGMVQP